MSITLTAHPTAFLINPEKAKDITLSEVMSNIKEKTKSSIVSKFSSLKSVRVLTNLRMGEIQLLMSAMDNVRSVGDYKYKMHNGLTIEWKYQDGYCCAILSGKPAYKVVPKYSEEFFRTLEKFKARNVRDINSEELFYYNYETKYTSVKQIADELNFRGAINVEITPNMEVKAYYNNQNIRYYIEKDEQYYTLETEQKISLVNIGIDNSIISNVIIKTNITPQELKSLLEHFGYIYNETTSETPMKMSSNIIKWELENGVYNAHLKNVKANHIRGEVEHLFVAMNKKAGRDLRIIENKVSSTYTYNTNYTDKGVLINTLTEHGAKNLTDEGDKITCELFGMKMAYTKESSNNAFNLIIEHVTDKNECKNLLSDLNDEYGLNIQEITYKKILERLNSENMRLESEEVTDDNSIVLTIEV